MDSPIRVLVLVAFFFPIFVDCAVRHYKFNVGMKNTTRLCSSKTIVTVNGMVSGNYKQVGLMGQHISHNVRSRQDKAMSITLPSQANEEQSYVYNFTITGQRGTLLWHAHILWLRSTVHGAIVILPKRGVPYPFLKPNKEVVVVLAEWWKSDTEAVINEALKSGLAPNVSDAHTINGLPGRIPGCPSQRGFKLPVESGKTYLLRLINAALNEELFFKVAGHKLTVVEVDATYVKPFKTDTVVIAPGQTTNVLFSADKRSGKYLVAASPFMDAPVAVDNVTATATLHYSGTLDNVPTTLTTPPPKNATAVANSFIDSLRALNSKQFPALWGVHRRFPEQTATLFNYTGTPPANLQTRNGTKVFRLAYNSTVQLVLQDTGIIAPENHPIHLHGYNFFAVGKGLRNYNPKTDPQTFDLVDPVERNTIGNLVYALPFGSAYDMGA
ncbi:Laccase-16 [Hibiscus syriacus]|uniref:laccase n=1 Tax=Hibiscus syriacus TaxID=106335 RepID=A0A6A2Z5W5_HIBSY|nr:Laccase-16 [Hibiscus syriacus]